MKKKSWITQLIIALAILFAVVLLAVSFWNIRSSETYMESYVRYSELEKGMKQAKLTVMENGSIVGVYDLEQLGLLNHMEKTAQECFGFIGAPEAENFSKLSVKERRMAFRNVEKGSVSVDMDILDTTEILEDLQTVNRGKGDLFPEDLGAQVDEAALRDVLETELSHWAATEEGMENRTIILSDCAIYTCLNAGKPVTYKEYLSRVMKGLTIPITLRDGEEELEISSVVQVGENGVGSIDILALEETIDDYADQCPTGWLPYRLESYGRGSVDLDFFHVHYTMDRDLMGQQLREQIKALDTTPIVAEYACTREGKDFIMDASYIEVDIARQKMMYYENGEMLVCTDVVTGLPNGRWTWPGMYRIQDKDEERQLIGWDYNVHVKYWLGYDGDYGIHDAEWRDVFGGDEYLGNGSHGCTNTPLEPMAQIFEKVDVGTRVIVHYVKE